MIVAIEGNVGAGKTTLAHMLSTWAHVEAEYDHLVQADTAEAQWTVQGRYLRLEGERRERLGRLLTRFPDRHIVLDRSVISQAAHVYSLAVVGVVDNRRRLASCLEQHGESVVIPDVQVHLSPEAHVRRSQLGRRECGPQAIGTDSALDAYAYADAVEQFLEQLGLRTGTRTLRLSQVPMHDPPWRDRLVTELLLRADAGLPTMLSALIAALRGRR